MQPSCECRSFTPFRGIDKDQARKLRKRKRTSKRQPDVSEEERWREMYRITCGIAPQTSRAADNFFRSYQILNPAENVGASITPGLKQQHCITQTSSRPSQTDSMGHANPPIPCTYEGFAWAKSKLSVAGSYFRLRWLSGATDKSPKISPLSGYTLAG